MCTHSALNSTRMSNHGSTVTTPSRARQPCTHRSKAVPDASSDKQLHTRTPSPELENSSLITYGCTINATICKYAKTSSETQLRFMLGSEFVHRRGDGRNATVTNMALTTFGPRAFIAARTASSEWHTTTSLFNRVTHERRRCSPATPHGRHFLGEIPVFVAHEVAEAGTLASNFCSPPRSGSHDNVIISLCFKKKT